MPRTPEKGALGRTARWLALVGAASACFAAPDEPAPSDGGLSTGPTAGTPDTAARTATAPANGWGDEIAWRGLEEGRREADALGRPLMLIVWTSWCGNCRALKQRFAANEQVRTLSHEFVMVNVDQDEVPEVSGQGPDGDYIPRVIFFGADGEIDEGVLNDQRHRSRYFYSPVDDVAAKMRLALERHEKRS